MEDPTPAKRSPSPLSSRSTPVPSISPRAATASKSPTSVLRKNIRQTPEGIEKYLEISISEEMEEEKKRYPGASRWARDEERLFEILYRRQDLPILPPTWDIDLSGVPISDTIFKTSDEFRPIIYAHGKDFRATTSLMRLIDLTSRVRSNIQTGHTKKVPGLIKRELDKFLGWAAHDGDYAHLRTVPNILTEVIDTTMEEKYITEYIDGRMRALAKLQREFLKVDEDPEFWDVVKPSILVSPIIKIEPEDESPGPERWARVMKRKNGAAADIDELSNDTPSPKRAKMDTELVRRRLFSQSTRIERVELIQSPLPKEPGDTTKSPRTKDTEIKQELGNESSGLPSPPHVPDTDATSVRLSYRRHPPVVYGLFILNTSVLILTTDSSQGDDGYVSFQVQINFQDHHQSVWNALTVAIVICLARDKLMARTSDFEKLPVVKDSDPDA